jgi:AcrR family transcriptional regulator
MVNKPSDTRAAILSAAHTLFWKHGFRRVSVEEICTKAGISKMTFYRYFGNKIELAKTVFLDAANEGYDRMKAIFEGDTTPEEKINQILFLKFEGTNDISEEFLRDFYTENESGLSDFVKSATELIWKKITDDFKAAQKKGIFRDDINFEHFFYISRKISDSFNDHDFAGLFSSPQEMIMETARLLMYGIAPRNK